MSLQYAEAKIREALKHAKGNRARTQQIVAAMAQQDVKLLQALTKHHLSGIVAYHVERVVSGKTPQLRSKPTNRAAPILKSRTGDQNMFGMEILKAVSGPKAEVFGFDSGAPTGPRGKASQNHINAIHQMADRAKSKQ